MSNAGKKVAVHYVGTLDNGEVFDSSRERNQPLEFVCMAGQMIKGFDAAVENMQVGDIVDVRLEPSEAYGERDEKAVRSFPLASMPGAKNLEPGARVVLTAPDGQPVPATCVMVNETHVTFDFNHEMAGKALNFNIELLSVED